ncbi:fused nickel transport protein NikMN [bacterium BMS3Bbin06]|nr:fused nickel transport protein NikMN [bacterium BMS3Bbin06]HDY71804.1 cobalamin biosynthesis protein CbiM [Nitrospirota bacterium]
MHMADALLSPTVGGGFWAGTIGVIVYAARRLKERIDERLIPLMGVLGAFVFAGQMINFTIPGTGSSGHIGGGMLLAILIGPNPAFIVIASVLTVQALFFADGGLLALGCNIWNLGIYPCFIAYPLIYRVIVKDNPTAKRITIGAILSVVVALQLGAFSVVLQTELSGISELPFSTFVMLMLPLHLAIGVVEGLITAGVVNYVRVLQPDIVESTAVTGGGGSLKKAIIAIAVLAVITGGVLSWFASTHPDGLEWSIERIYGKPELPEGKNGIRVTAAEIQKKTALLPHYGFPSEDKAGKTEGASQWPAVDPGTSVSGLVGGVIVLVLVSLTGIGLKMLGRKSGHRDI